MPLEPGTSFGVYEIVAPIGAGGMGTVFRARDTRLGRDVALKLLPESFQHDPDRIARFRREAQVLASLNQPNIGAIYGLEESGGAQAIVLELVDSETLADRLQRGSLPLSDQLEIGRQIAEALDAAHDRGIVHRDLKPSNVMVRADGVVKVVDFGLATPTAAARPGSGVAQAPTVTSPPATAAGVVLGTAPYMSPEQAKGKPVDRRADLWAVGCILYELATGQRAFDGDSTTDTMAAILTREPDWSRVPPTIPPALTALIARCLRKESRQRVQSAGDVRVALEECQRDPVAAAVSAPRARVGGGLLLFAAAAGLLIGATASAIFLRGRSGPPAATEPALRAVLQLPADAPLWLDDGESIAFSRDGRLLAWVGGSGAGRRIYIRAIDAMEAAPVPGTEGATNPFFSPDGQWIGFFTIGALKKIPIAGGSATMLAPAGETTRGGAWGDDNTIVFSQSVDTPLRRVAAAGGATTDVTKLSALTANSHRFPAWVPGRQALLYTLRYEAPTSGTRDLAIAAIDLATGAETIVMRDAAHPMFLPTGELLFVRNGTLFLVPFDISRLRTSGAEKPVVAGVHVSSAHAAQCAVGGTRLVFVAGGPSDADDRFVAVRRDLAGDERVLLAEPSGYRDLRFSPDGRRLAYADFAAGRGAATDLWVADLHRDVKVRLAGGAAGEWRPVWTRDGRHIFYADTSSGIYCVRADGSGAPVRLTTTTASQVPVSLSPDGKYLAYHEERDFTGDIWILPVDPVGPPRKFFEGSAAETLPVFSPNGKWIAYVSNESGSPQLYVRPFPSADAKGQVSSTGTLDEHAWSPDGTKLYFRNGEGTKLMVAPIATQDAQLEVGRATPLFDLSADDYPDVAFWGGLALAPDGRGFAMVKKVPRAPRDQPLLVLLADWIEAARRGDGLVPR